MTQKFANETLVVIPSRIGSTRLPRKSLVKIGNKTMIELVTEKVIESGLKNIYVATDSDEIAAVLAKSGINSIMTAPEIPSGTDRVFDAWQKLPNKTEFKYIINVQGDMPFLSPEIILETARTLWQTDSDIVTPVAKVDYSKVEGDSNVKVVSTINNKVLYFSRSRIPCAGDNYLYHVGIYGYKADSLDKFVKLPISFLERTEKLEQLRALENGMTIEICYVKTIPISIDTPEDLKKAENYYNSLKN